MTYGLKEHIIKQINSVFANYQNVKKVILYGSRAKGNYKVGSDIDLTIIAEDMSLSGLHKIENDLDDLLLPYTIDLSIFSHIKNQDLISHINRVGLVFYSFKE